MSKRRAPRECAMSTPCAPEEYPLITAAAKSGAHTRSPLPHLRRDWAPPPRPHLHRDWPSPCPHLRGDCAFRCHICDGTGPALIATWQRRTRTVLQQPLPAASPRPALPQWRSAAAVNGHSTASRGPPKRYSRRAARGNQGVLQGVTNRLLQWGAPVGCYRFRHCRAPQLLAITVAVRRRANRDSIARASPQSAV